MSETVNTTKSVKENKDKVTMEQLDADMKKAAKALGEEKKVEVHIPGYLKSRLGGTVPVGVNGAVIHVPVGKKVKIPESMAAILNESLSQLSL